jgi:hypothetical protein
MSRVYANLYVLLVAPPGVGKSVAIYQGAGLTDRTKKLKVAPDDVTKASLLDHLAAALQTRTYGPADFLEYHSLQVFADEFGVFCPSHDTGFLSVMNKLFDNGPRYKESRRGREGDLIINNPQVNLLAGTQPDFLANLLPPEAWGMGFMSRMLMVYAGKSEKPKLFGKRVKVETESLLSDLKVICELHGEMDWDDAAAAELESWYERGMDPEPQHTKLQHYIPRRILTMIKLSMISSVARSNDLIILPEDVARAREWLLEIEALMPEIFKAMNGVSDIQIIQDLHYAMWEMWAKGNKKPLHISRVYNFLQARAPSYAVANIIKVCFASKVLKDLGADLFEPGDHNNLRDE